MDALHESYLADILEQRRRRGVLRSPKERPVFTTATTNTVSSRARYIRPPTPPTPLTTSTGVSINKRNVPASTQTTQVVVAHASPYTRLIPAPSLVTEGKATTTSRSEIARELLHREASSSSSSSYSSYSNDLRRIERKERRSDTIAVPLQDRSPRRALASLPPSYLQHDYHSSNRNTQPMYYDTHTPRPTPRISLSQRIQQQQQQQRLLYSTYTPLHDNRPMQDRGSSLNASARRLYTRQSSSSSPDAIRTANTSSSNDTPYKLTSTYTTRSNTVDGSMRGRAVYAPRPSVPAPSHVAEDSHGIATNSEEDDIHDVNNSSSNNTNMKGVTMLRSSSTTSRVSQPDAFSEKSNPTSSRPNHTPLHSTTITTQRSTPLQRQETRKPTDIVKNSKSVATISKSVPGTQLRPTQSSPREADKTATPRSVVSASSSSFSSAHTSTPQQPQLVKRGKEQEEEKKADVSSPAQASLSKTPLGHNRDVRQTPVLAVHYTDTNNTIGSRSSPSRYAGTPSPLKQYSTPLHRDWRMHSAPYHNSYSSATRLRMKHSLFSGNDVRQPRSASYSATTRPTTHSPTRYNNNTFMRSNSGVGKSRRDGSLYRALERTANYGHSAWPLKADTSLSKRELHGSNSSRHTKHGSSSHHHHTHHHPHSHHRNKDEHESREHERKEKHKKDNTARHHSLRQQEDGHRHSSHHKHTHRHEQSNTMHEQTSPAHHPSHLNNTTTTTTSNRRNTSASSPVVQRLPSHALERPDSRLRPNTSQHYSLLQTLPASSPLNTTGHPRRALRTLPEVRSTLDLRTSARILQAGEWFYKWCRGDTVVKQRWVWLETRSHLLVWSRKQTIHSSFSGSLPLESLWQITPRELLQPDHNGITRVYYVLQIYTTKRTLQLATERKDKADTWFEALYNVMGFIRRHDLTRGALTPD